MSNLSPLTHCPHCNAELPPYTPGCPRCNLDWRSLIEDRQFRDDERVGKVVAASWLAISLAVANLTGVSRMPPPTGDWFELALLCGYPGTLLILALYGRSRNRGYAALIGGSRFYLILAPIWFVNFFGLLLRMYSGS